MASFAIALYSAPYTSQSSLTALRFCQTLLSQGHNIHRVFFYNDAVHNASLLATPPQGELDIVQAWRDLKAQHDIDLVVCIAAALKRGLLDEKEAHRYSKPAHNLAPEFELSGLGQLVDAAISADRLITFGK